MNICNRFFFLFCLFVIDGNELWKQWDDLMPSLNSVCYAS